VTGPDAVAVSVDPTWLRGLSTKQFPLTIDPTTNLFIDASNNSPSSFISYGYPSGLQTDGRVGHDPVAGGDVWRTVTHFAYEDHLNAVPNWQVVSADLAVTATGSQSHALWAYRATGNGFDFAINGGKAQPGSPLPLTPPQGGGAAARFDVTNTVRQWF